MTIFPEFTALVDWLILCSRYLGWQVLFSSLLFVPVYLILRLAGRRWPEVQLWLGAMLLVRLVLPTDFNLAISARNFWDHLWRYSPDGGAMGYGDPFFLPPIETLASGHIPPEAGIPWQVIPALIWLCGGAAALLLWGRKRLILRRLLRESHPVSSPELLRILETWRRRLKIRRPVRLLCSGQYHFPFATGMVRPVIFLPASLLDQSRHLEAIIAHECVHIRRWDGLWAVLQDLLHCFYFFHPVSWYAGRQIRIARERLCDRAVLLNGFPSPAAYGRALLAVLQNGQRREADPLFEPGFSLQNTNIYQRIYDLKGENSMTVGKRNIMLTLTLLLGLFLLPMAPVTPLGAASPPPAQEPQAEGDFQCPMNTGTITSRFGAPGHGSNGKWTHKGIDIKAPLGTAVFSAASGVVTFAQYNGAYGNHIAVEHRDGLITRYAHLSKIDVKVGENVEAGQKIGEVGSTGGKSTGPHLHFEFLINDTFVNPETYVTFELAD
ncbi:MAG: peptidoglycan DD-metalloendopeptidase family protein [Calditrichaeota bacterium]|nr:peptidoglycan DD-metalloendopeptidase family protein [Calditrichota bacterium]